MILINNRLANSRSKISAVSSYKYMFSRTIFQMPLVARHLIFFSSPKVMALAGGAKRSMEVALKEDAGGYLSIG